MAFVQAMMNTTDDIKKGVNGADVYTEKGVGNYLLTLFTMLNRGQSFTYIQDHVKAVCDADKEAYERGDYHRGFGRRTWEAVRDLYVMAFQTRDVRGGKGEKKLFYNFFLALYRQDNVSARELLSLVPEYGCWRDMWELMHMIPELEHDILLVAMHQFVKDHGHFVGGEASKMSLLAKWLPREGSGTYPGAAQKIAKVLFPNETSERKRIIMYRKQVSAMNKVLKTVEVNMCGRHWAGITPEAVPGRCLKIHNKAFLNEPKTKQQTSGVGAELRYPDSEDRMECREHFLEFIEAMKKGEKTAKGADVVFPHELVAQLLRMDLSADQIEINQGQWNSIRQKTLELGGLGKCVPMCDFSGSMDGLPKLISLSLGILISEINHAAFKDHILTFDAEPTWHSFAGLETLQKKVDSIDHRLGQGLNTDFYKACMHILEKMKTHRVPVGEEPEDLIVLTDMGFDAAITFTRSYYEAEKKADFVNQLKVIREAFKKGGEEVWGEGQGWKPPRIVIWNLRATFNDFHAKADQEGVVQLSGWSPSMLKALQTNGVEIKTPYEGMRQILDDPRYDAVRAAWEKMHSLPSVPSE
jgi:hypothetical protein